MIKINRSVVSLIIVLSIILVGAGAYLYLHSPLRTSQAASSKDVYYCPMHPSYTSNRPGNCPICNMTLVKKEAETTSHATHENAQAAITPKEMTLEEFMKLKPGQVCLLHKCKMGNCMMAITPDLARLGKCPHCGEDLGVMIKDLMPGGYGNVKLSPEKAEMIGIKTTAAKKIKMNKTIRTVGRIAYDPELYQAEEEYLQAVQALKKAEAGTIEEVKEQASKMVDSAKIKLKLLGLSDELVGEFEKTGKPDRSLLYSEAGAKAWLYAPIYEYEMSLVKVGDKLNIEIPAVPGKTFEGTVRAIDSVLDPMTRTVRIRAILDNTEGILKPEMYVNANLQTDLGEVVAVPEEAIFSTGEKNILFVAKSDGVFEPREVVLGIKTNGFAEIKSGVAEGESVVTSGNFSVDSESRLKAALEGIAAGSHNHG